MLMNVNEYLVSITMLTLTVMHDNDTASNFKATIRIPFVFG